MKQDPVYKDLNTSFVSLSDLLKCLRRERFVGRVHLKSGKYEADITVSDDQELEARENIGRNGKVLTNKDILRHVLIRSREPGGVINVYRQKDAQYPIFKRLLPRLQKKFDAVREEYSFSNAHLTTFLPRIRKQRKAISPAGTRQVARPLPLRSARAISNPQPPKRVQPQSRIKKPVVGRIPPQEPPKIRKMNERVLSDWDIAINLMNEIIATVDRRLSDANVNFAWMFETARLESGTPGTAPYTDATVFSYENGRLLVHQRTDLHIFIENILAVLKGVMRKLRRNSRLTKIYKSIIEEIQALVHERRDLYDKYSITSRIQELAAR